MATGKIPHLILIGSTKFSVQEKDVFDTIKDIVGVKKMADTDRADFKTTVNELRTNGAALLITARTESGKTHRILCATDKLAGAMGGLIGKLIPESSGTGTTASTASKKIVSVSIPRKRSRN
jgi:hypothetical protein